MSRFLSRWVVLRVLAGFALGGCSVSSALAAEGAEAVEADEAQLCPASFAAQPPADPDQRQSEAVRLAGLGEACRERATYFSYYGALLLTLKRPQEAALALEKALLLDPDLAGTQLDYAQVLAELGELESARSLAGEVSKRPDIPMALQAWLSEQLSAWKGADWRVAWSMELLGGAESNLNSAPGIQFLTLTLPGGNVPVELDASESRLSGKALRSDLTASAVRSLGEGAVQFSGEYFARNSQGQSSTDQNLLSVSAAYVHPVLSGQLGARFEQTRIWMGGESTYVSNGWSLLYQLPQQLSPGGCATSLGYAGEGREFPNASYQNGRYTGAQAWLSCHWADWQFNLGLQSGEDRALDPIRLGGNQRREDVSVGVGRKLGSDTLALSVLSGRTFDQQDYSSLLGGETRRIDRLAGRLSYEHPFSKRWSAVGYLENTAQTSNIELFNMKNKALYLGVKFHGG